MEDPRWLKLITIGLVLAALAVGYFLISGRFASNSIKKIPASTNQTVSSASPSASTPTILGQTTQTSSKTISSVTPSPSPITAFNRIVNRNQNEVSTIQELPKTGFPVGLVAMLSISAIISGWGLRKYPH